MVGLAELVKVAAFADSCGVEVLDFVKQSPNVTTCEMVGRKLSYFASLDVDGTLWLWVSSADDASLPQRILSGVSINDWKTVARVISALEFSQVCFSRRTTIRNRPAAASGDIQTDLADFSRLTLESATGQNALRMAARRPFSAHKRSDNFRSGIISEKD